MFHSLAGRFGIHRSQLGTAPGSTDPDSRTGHTQRFRLGWVASLLTIAFVVLYLAVIRPQLMPTGSTVVVELAIVVLLVLALLVLDW